MKKLYSRNKQNKKFQCIHLHTFIDCFNEHSVILDLGANKGKFGKAFRKKFPDVQMILVEGNPRLASHLESKFKHDSGIEILPVLVGEESKENVTFYLSNIAQASSVYKEYSDTWSFLGIRKNRGEVQVNMMTIEDIMAAFRVDKIDLLKMDVEGIEWGILNGLTEDLYNRIAQISVEFHDFYQKNVTKTKSCIERLQAMGYSYVHKHPPFHPSSLLRYHDVLFYKESLLQETDVPTLTNA